MSEPTTTTTTSPTPMTPTPTPMTPTTSPTPMSDTQRKISLFENTEREKAEKEERDRKRALFARKLSKFGENVDLNGGVGVGKESVGAKVKMFTEAPGSEERRKEAERRKSEFRRKLSAFSGEKFDDDVDVRTSVGVVTTRRVSETARIFSGAGNGEDPEEAERQRCQEEERLRKVEQFRAKREIFSN